MQDALIFWSVAILFIVGAVAFILLPLIKRSEVSDYDAVNDHARRDMIVYKDQLQELDLDLERGLIGAAEAAAARTEIGRRLIVANDLVVKETVSVNGINTRLAGIGAILIIPAIALALYYSLGSPNLPDQPLAMRLQKPAKEKSLIEMVATVERHLSNNPKDGRGWEILGPIYMRQNQYEKAVTAFKNVLVFNGKTAVGLTNVAEAIVSNDAGSVSGEAVQYLVEARNMEPEAIRPRFFLAIATEQTGDKTAGTNAWKSLLQRVRNPSEPWVAVARARLKNLQGVPVQSREADLPGPDADRIREAANLSEEQRQNMISGMVTRLKSRLEADGGSVDEWLRLVRVLGVQGRKSDAVDAARQALSAFKNEPNALIQLNSAFATAGIAIN